MLDNNIQPAILSVQPSEYPNGFVLQGEHGKYEIIERLGAGLTAVVYKARQQQTGEIVAIKVLKETVSDETKNYFWFEATILEEVALAGAEQAIHRYDIWRDSSPRFLALEFIGTDYIPLNKWIDNHGLLSEAEALEISHQALDLLDKLHTRVQRTYTDMKLENFYWNANQRHLRVIDWNHVSPKRQAIEKGLSDENPEVRGRWQQDLHALGAENFDELVQNDLIRFATFIYQLITGKAASPQGEYENTLKARGGEAWEALSEATRQVFTQSLSPNKLRRFPSAAEFQGKIEGVQNLWKGVDAGKIRRILQEIRGVKENIRQGHQKPENNTLSTLLLQAAAMIDMYERIASQEDKDLYLKRFHKDREEIFTDEMPYAWNDGKIYYETGQYLTAAIKWQETASLQGRLDMVRWVILALSASQLGQIYGESSELRSACENSLLSLNINDYDLAYNGFQSCIRLIKHININTPPAFEILIQEIERHILYDTAEEKIKSNYPDQWKSAIQDYKDIQNWLQSVDSLPPDAEGLQPWLTFVGLLKSTYGWDSLETKIGALQDKLQQMQQARAALEEIRNELQRDFNAGFGKMEVALHRNPQDQGLLELCLEFTQKANLGADNKRRLLELGLNYGQVPSMEAALQKVYREVRYDILQPALSTALKQRNWGRLVGLAEELSHVDTNKSKFFIKELEQQFEKYSRKDLIGARAIDKALNSLAGPDEYRMHKIQQLVELKEEELKHADNIELLQKQSQMNDFSEKMRQFVNDIVLEELSKSPSEHGQIISRIQNHLNEIQEVYSDLREEGMFITWNKKFEEKIVQLEERKNEVTLQPVDDLLDEAFKSIGGLTDEGLKTAEEKYKDAELAFKNASVKSDSKRRKEVIDRLTVCNMLLYSSEQLIEPLNTVRNTVNRVKQNLIELQKDAFNGLEDAGRKLVKIRKNANPETWEARAGIKPLYPVFDELEKEIEKLELVRGADPVAENNLPGKRRVGIFSDPDLALHLATMTEAVQELTNNLGNLANTPRTLMLDSRYEAKPESIKINRKLLDVQTLVLLILGILILIPLFYQAFKPQGRQTGEMDVNALNAMQTRLAGLEETVKNLDHKQTTASETLSVLPNRIDDMKQQIIDDVMNQILPPSKTTPEIPAVLGLKLKPDPDAWSFPLAPIFDLLPQQFIPEQGWKLKTDAQNNLIAVDPNAGEHRLSLSIFSVNEENKQNPVDGMQKIPLKLVASIINDQQIVSWYPSNDAASLPSGKYVIVVESDKGEKVTSDPFEVVAPALQVTDRVNKNQDGLRKNLKEDGSTFATQGVETFEVLGWITCEKQFYLRVRKPSSRDFYWLQGNLAVDNNDKFITKDYLIKTNIPEIKGENLCK